MRRLVEAEIAAVIDRRQALVRALGIMDAVIALTARHQRRDHHLRSDRQRLAHEIFGELRAALDDDAAKFVAQRKRPRQWLWPVALQNVQISAADAARADLDQRRLPADLRPRHGADHRLRARALMCANANLFHGISSGPSLIIGSSSHGSPRRPRTLHATAANTSLTLSALGSSGRRVAGCRVAKCRLRRKNHPVFRQPRSDGAFNG